jgi:heme-degrading monooxygenase HmoA
MYTAIRRGKSNPGSMNELARRLQDGFVPILRNQPGFIAYYFVNLGNDEAMSISVFETKDAAEKSNQLSADWNKQNIAQLMPAPAQASTGEVLVNVTKHQEGARASSNW